MLRQSQEQGPLYQLAVGNRELLLLVLLFCDDRDLFALMQTARVFTDLCKDENVWQVQLTKRFPPKESGYYPERLNKKMQTALGFFQTHLRYGTYDFVSLYFDDQFKNFNIHVTTPQWRRTPEDQLSIVGGLHKATQQANIHPLFKKALMCQSYESCLLVLQEIEKNASCQVFLESTGVTLPYAYNNFKGRSFAPDSSLAGMINYLSDRIAGKPIVRKREQVQAQVQRKKPGGCLVS